MTKRLAIPAFSAAAYLFFLAVLLYSAGFLNDLVVPKGVDGPAGPVPAAVAVDLGLLLLFAVQHSVMARPAFKRAWTRVVPAAAERSVYVLAASAVLALLYWQWRPVAGDAWRTGGALAAVILALYFAGWGLVVASTWMIDHFDLFGLRQAYLHWSGRPYSPLQFTARAAYGLVRHPMMTGLLVAFWAAPVMTWGHLLFAAAASGYVLVGIHFEERDLRRELGPPYEEYARQVPMLLPLPQRREDAAIA